MQVLRPHDAPRRFHVAEAPHHALRLDRPRGERIDPDVLPRMVDCHRLGELDQGGLGGTIGRPLGLPTRPSCDPIWMMLPPPAAIIIGRTARLIR